MSGSGRGRGAAAVCGACKNPVCLSERLLVGSPPRQLMHSTCFRCTRCATQLAPGSCFELEKGKYCCKTCPVDLVRGSSVSSDVSDKISSSNNISVEILSSQSQQSSFSSSSSSTPDKEFNTKSVPENPCEEIDSYSQDAEMILEGSVRDASPRPLKPRTIFLTRTLEEGTDLKTNPKKQKKNTDTGYISPNRTRLSPPVPYSDIHDSRETVTDIPGAAYCDNVTKGFRMNRTEALPPDTGQDSEVTHDSDKNFSASSSTVAQRLKFFSEISEKSAIPQARKPFSIQRQDNIDEKHSQNYEKEIYSKNRDSNNSAQAPFMTENPPRVKHNTSAVDVGNIIKVNYNREGRRQIASATFSSNTTNINHQERQSIFKNAHTSSQTKTSKKQQTSKRTFSQEYNPFHDEAESQRSESHVKERQSCGKDEVVDNCSQSASQKSWSAQFSSSRVHSVQYSDDLNPFGDSDRSQVKDIPTKKTSVARRSDPQVHHRKKPTKKPVKVDFNPFESEDSEDEKYELELSQAKNVETRNANPFLSDADKVPVDHRLDSRRHNRLPYRSSLLPIVPRNR